MKNTCILLVRKGFLTAVGALAFQIASADESDGKKAFENHCAECHAEGFGHPGTQRLGWNRGQEYAVLTKRTDLSAEYIAHVVRQGLLEMPPFRPSEITDSELAKLCAYLAKTSVNGH